MHAVLPHGRSTFSRSTASLPRRISPYRCSPSSDRHPDDLMTTTVSRSWKCASSRRMGLEPKSIDKKAAVNTAAWVKSKIPPESPQVASQRVNRSCDRCVIAPNPFLEGPNQDKLDKPAHDAVSPFLAGIWNAGADLKNEGACRPTKGDDTNRPESEFRKVQASGVHVRKSVWWRQFNH